MSKLAGHDGTGSFIRGIYGVHEAPKRFLTSMVLFCYDINKCER